MRCIYCKEDKPPSSFKKREHVIAQAFGRFSPDNLVLRECVCDDCNKLFGNQIELFLARDTFESIERLRHGIKPKEPLRNRRRIKSKIRTGPWKDVVVREHLAESGQLAIEKVMQAGFYHTERGGYDFFELEKIPTGEELEERGYDVKKATIRLIAADDGELDTLLAKLNEQRISVKPKADLVKQEFPGDIVPVETCITLDRTIMRGFCKIAFNYLAFVAGPGFVLSPDFDGIRRFVRNGEGDFAHFFGVNLPPILHHDQLLEKIGMKVTEGHLITVGWRNGGVVSKVSIFNKQTFGISLCKEFSGIWRPIRSGHYFDIKSKQVSKLVSVSKTLML